MILRVSGKLGKKIGVKPTESLPLHENPYLDWSGHLFRVHRVQHIILTNTASLYSLLFLGRGITTPKQYAKHARNEIRKFLKHDGNEAIYNKFIAPHTETVSFSKALNRSVIGSVNDMVSLSKFRIEQMGMSLLEVGDQLNKTPMFYLEEFYPEIAFQSLLDNYIYQ